MVNIGVEGIPKMYPGQTAIITNGSNIQTGILPFVETDTVGQGYPDATPVLVPQGSASGAVVITTPKIYEGILPRHNTPDNPAEQGGKVIMNLTSGIFIPVIQFTPPEVMP